MVRRAALHLLIFAAGILGGAIGFLYVCARSFEQARKAAAATYR